MMNFSLTGDAVAPFLCCWLDDVEFDCVCHELFESSDDEDCWIDELSVDWFDARQTRWITILLRIFLSIPII